MLMKDIADLYVTAVGKVEFYWNFYTVTLLAMIGWMVSTKNPLAPRLKVLITVGFLFFALMNLLGLYGSYGFTEAIRKDLLSVAELKPEILSNSRKALSENSFEFQRHLAILIHVIVDGFVVWVIWRAQLGNKKPGIQQPINSSGLAPEQPAEEPDKTIV